MSRKRSTVSKIRDKVGTGEKENWKPWITTRELNSLGTTSNYVDWKHGREMQLLSQAELWVYLVLRWNDDIDDIREQYPLDIETTKMIANQLGFRHPGNGTDPMTSDMYIVRKNGTIEIVSVKDSPDVLKDNRTVEKLAIEKIYWLQKGINWRLEYKSRQNPVLISNLMLCLPFYKAESVFDQISYAKHLIATKQLSIPLDKKELEITKIACDIERSGLLWTNLKR